MNNLYRKIIWATSSTLILSLPMFASSDPVKEEFAEREKVLYKQELTVSGNTSGTGKLLLKGETPITDGNTFKYRINIAKIPAGLLYEETGHPSEKGKGQFNNIDITIEKSLKWIKGILQEGCIEYTDETGKQSIQFGIISSHYNSAQLLGVQMKTKDIMFSFDIEGILRLSVKRLTQWKHFSFFKGKAYGPDQNAFKNSTSSLVHVKLIWDFSEDAQLTIGGSLSKGDYQPIKRQKNGFDIGKYIASCTLSYAFGNNPLLGFLENITLQATNLTDKREKGALLIVPSLSLSLGLGKINILEEAPEASFSIAYCFCDINKKYTRTLAPNATVDNPYHISVGLNLTFKDAFEQKGLKIAPKLDVKYTTQSFTTEWEPNNITDQQATDARKKYKKISWNLNIEFSFTKTISSEYYAD